MIQFRAIRELSALALVGALAMTGCFVVEDSNDDDDNGGESGEAGEDSGGSGGSSRGGSSNGGSPAQGGSSNGGTESGGSSNGGSSNGGTESGGSSNGGTDSGGTDSGGSGPGTGGSATGGSGGAPPGGAVMKFCNLLVAVDDMGNPMDIVLEVDIAGTRASANSGECSPVVPASCLPVATGENPSATLYDGDAVVIEGSFPTVTIGAGEEWLVAALLDDMTDPNNPVPALSAILFAEFCTTDCTCAETDPITFMPPEASQPMRFDLGGQRRFRMVANATEILRENGITKSSARFVSK